ncbi:hypothetical protein QJS10_CPB18g02126 [Acorus calamus]|uniref:Uncharacterized protein n=1 Tax=Acorus calamus TaxID=4465 RepID=A0AAV9CQZ9_ACOCL|nr:hypothetical protein QJS10_CPB18g02126 [Acorus calamus]
MRGASITHSDNHRGMSNASPADCPILRLALPRSSLKRNGSPNVIMTTAAFAGKFKNIDAIVDPPRVGLHPITKIKTTDGGGP